MRCKQSQHYVVIIKYESQKMTLQKVTMRHSLSKIDSPRQIFAKSYVPCQMAHFPTHVSIAAHHLARISKTFFTPRGEKYFLARPHRPNQIHCAHGDEKNRWHVAKEESFHNKLPTHARIGHAYTFCASSRRRLYSRMDGEKRESARTKKNIKNLGAPENVSHMHHT
jgi:hypothetical protein